MYALKSSAGVFDFRRKRNEKGKIVGNRRDEQCSSAVRVNQQTRRKTGVFARTHNVRPYECVHSAKANQILSFVNIRTEPHKFDFRNRLVFDLTGCMMIPTGIPRARGKHSNITES